MDNGTGITPVMPVGGYGDGFGGGNSILTRVYKRC